MEAPDAVTLKRGNADNEEYGDGLTGSGARGGDGPVPKRSRLLQDDAGHDAGADGGPERSLDQVAAASAAGLAGADVAADDEAAPRGGQPFHGDSRVPTAGAGTGAEGPLPTSGGGGQAAAGGAGSAFDAVPRETATIANQLALLGPPPQQQHPNPLASSSVAAALPYYPHEQVAAAAGYLNPLLFGAGAAGAAALYSPQFALHQALAFSPQLAAAAMAAATTSAANPYLSSFWPAGMGPAGHPPSSAFLPGNAGLVLPAGFEQSVAALAAAAAASAGMGYQFPMQGLDLQSTSMAAAASAPAQVAAGLSNAGVGLGADLVDGDRAAPCGGGEPRVFPMSHPADEEAVSKYQCLLRKQIEFFEATPVDLKARAQGRNVPIRLRQIGIRCRHCADAGIPPGFRPRGSVYFPVKLASLYQSAQNMANNHWSTSACSSIPESVLAALNDLKRSKYSGSGSGGHKHWIRTAQSIGIDDSAETGLEYQESRATSDQDALESVAQR